jgi:hypothetical protein
MEAEELTEVDWTALPSDLIGLIFLKLEEEIHDKDYLFSIWVTDYLALWSTCSTFRNIALNSKVLEDMKYLVWEEMEKHEKAVEDRNRAARLKMIEEFNEEKDLEAMKKWQKEKAADAACLRCIDICVSCLIPERRDYY